MIEQHIVGVVLVLAHDDSFATALQNKYTTANKVA
jgi:hypothetical protein